MNRLWLMLKHPSVAIMALSCAFATVCLLTFGPWWAVAFAPLGVGAQMLNEYNLHRFVFHMPPPRRQWAFDLLYQAHYGHHDFPTHVPLFFVPIWIALPMLVINFSVLWAILGALGVPSALWISVAVVPVGGVLTFLSYEWFHMTAHLILPKTWIEKRVTRLHNQHHFRDFTRWFHVSPGGEIIDRALGTAIDEATLKSAQRTEFMRTLGLRPDDPRLLSARARFAQKYGLSSDDCARAAMVQNS